MKGKMQFKLEIKEYNVYHFCICGYLTFIVPAHRLWCVHLNSHGTKAPTMVRCSHLNAQYTHVEA